MHTTDGLDEYHPASHDTHRVPPPPKPVGDVSPVPEYTTEPGRHVSHEVLPDTGWYFADGHMSHCTPDTLL